MFVGKILKASKILSAFWIMFAMSVMFWRLKSESVIAVVFVMGLFLLVITIIGLIAIPVERFNIPIKRVLFLNLVEFFFGIIAIILLIGLTIMPLERSVLSAFKIIEPLLWAMAGIFVVNMCAFLFLAWSHKSPL
jgi:hypothetical protein